MEAAKNHCRKRICQHSRTPKADGEYRAAKRSKGEHAENLKRTYTSQIF